MISIIFAHPLARRGKGIEDADDRLFAGNVAGRLAVAVEDGDVDACVEDGSDLVWVSRLDGSVEDRALCVFLADSVDVERRRREEDLDDGHVFGLDGVEKRGEALDVGRGGRAGERPSLLDLSWGESDVCAVVDQDLERIGDVRVHEREEERRVACVVEGVDKRGEGRAVHGKQVINNRGHALVGGSASSKGAP